MTDVPGRLKGPDTTMYAAHFGFSTPLFEDGIAQDDGVFLGPEQRRVQANLTVAMSRRDSIAVLVGRPGVGKTTLGSLVVRNAATQLALGWLGTSPLTPHELLEQLLTEFGFTPYRTSRTERLQTWRQFLNEMGATDTRVCVLVENAHDLEPEVLRALDIYTAADPNGCSAANVVLTGLPTLRESLQAPELESLRQRVRLATELKPLREQELGDYLRHKTSAAGGDFERVFAADAVPALFAHSGGIVRVVENLCETLLTLAASRQAERIDAAMVTDIATNMLDLEAGLAEGPADTLNRAEAPDAAPVETPTAPELEATTAETPVPADPAPPTAATSEAPSAPQAKGPEAEAEPTPEPPADGLTAEDIVLASEAILDADLELETERAAQLEQACDTPPSIEEQPRAELQADSTPAASAEELDLPVLTDFVEPEPAVELHDEEQADPNADTHNNLALDGEPERDQAAETMQAMANAKVLEDISNSMAETLFGDTELETLSATLAVSSREGKTETGAEQPEQTSEPDAKPLRARLFGF